ncbi:MAG: sensor histidine kinase [Leptolyngbyaceae cyanobacterium]
MYTASPSKNSYQIAVLAANVRQFCQRQTDRLSEKLPLLDVWLVCWSQLWTHDSGQVDTCWYYLLRQAFHLQAALKDGAQFLQRRLTPYQENLQTSIQLPGPRLSFSLALITGLGANDETQPSRRIQHTTRDVSPGLLNRRGQVSIQPDNHDLLVLLQNAVTLLQPKIAAKNLTVVQPHCSVPLMVDGWQIEQVLQRLLDNAIQVSPVGGIITVGWQTSAQAVLITISDQGPGLDGVDIKQLFELADSRHSDGAGLAIAKKIILDHQGSIGAETLFQGGAKFSIFLPR